MIYRCTITSVSLVVVLLAGCTPVPPGERQVPRVSRRYPPVTIEGVEVYPVRLPSLQLPEFLKDQDSYFYWATCTTRGGHLELEVSQDGLCRMVIHTRDLATGVFHALETTRRMSPEQQQEFMSSLVDREVFGLHNAYGTPLSEFHELFCLAKFGDQYCQVMGEEFVPEALRTSRDEILALFMGDSLELVGYRTYPNGKGSGLPAIVREVWGR
ncbi:hypothetical protein [Planctomycetes bacterium Pan216]|uniref:hypothetical protein n=1 Tax=Kolteria novifilia TaxID=2527975 RepID=UPI0011A01FFD